jgi:hypothetical protein
MIPVQAEHTLAAASDVTAIAWAMSIRTRYLAGTAAQTILTETFAPMLALTWAHQALMRILIP